MFVNFVGVYNSICVLICISDVTETAGLISDHFSTYLTGNVCQVIL